MRRIPRTLAAGFTLWIAVWIPAYGVYYGPSAFLWLCDQGNLLIALGLWTSRALFLSWAAVGVLLVQILWTVDVAGRLLFDVHPIGGSEYMWDASIPPGIRLLSLFHVAVPPLLLWGLARTGYDRRGFTAQTLAAGVTLPLTWVLTSPAQDINWVYGPFGREQAWMPGWAYLLLCMAAYPLLLFLPTHLLLRRLFREPSAAARATA